MLSNKCKTFFPISRLYIPTVHCVRVRSTPYKGDKILVGVFFFVPSSQNDRKKCPYLPKGQFLKKKIENGTKMKITFELWPPLQENCQLNKVY